MSADELEDCQIIPHFPHTRNTAFVGYEDHLRALQTDLLKYSIVALYGIGGVGLVLGHPCPQSETDKWQEDRDSHRILLQNMEQTAVHFYLLGFMRQPYKD